MSLLLPLPEQRTIGAARPFYSCKDVWGVTYNDRGVLTGDTLKRELVIDYNAATWRTYLPGDNAPLAEYPWLRFGGATCTQDTGNPALATVSLNYRQFAQPNGEGGSGGSGAPGQKLPDNYIEWSPGVIRVDIRRHPKWTVANAAWGGFSLADFWDNEKQAMREDEAAVVAGVAGLAEYIVGSCMVTAHYFSWMQPNDPSSLFGKRQPPPGLGGPFNWLIVSGTVNPQSGFWQKTLIFQYSDNTDAGPTALWAWLYPAA